jgi:hypothetical protein
MKIIDKTLVETVNWADDHVLSQLCRDEEYFVVVNPELDNSVLSLIVHEVPLNNNCVKYKIGEGWIAKRFPKNWNGQLQIVQLPIIPYSIDIGRYIGRYPVINSKVLNYPVPAWDLPYKHIWLYDPVLTNGEEVDAITVSYIKESSGRKVVGIIDTSYVNNVFDVIFLTYNEKHAQDNWQRLKSVCPRAKMVSGIHGIYNAHAEAARLSETEMFYVVDADAYVEDFQFDYSPPGTDKDTVHVWHSRNPVNGLEYGYGGIKLFTKSHFSKAQIGIIDVATSVSVVKVIPLVACETRFNTDEFSTWRSAFRECAKLSAGLIKNHVNQETQERLRVWTTVNNGAPYGEYAISGALAGAVYGKINAGDSHALARINDFDWLFEQFTKGT